MLPRLSMAAVCAVALLGSRPVLAQDEYLVNQERNQPTLPPVEVFPSQPSGQNYYNDGTDRGNYYGVFPYGTIPWYSDEIASDADLVGPYAQPAWTTQRPFATSRTYVLPPGQMQVEQWVRPTYPRNGKPEYRFLEEFAIGLPGRFQLDIYERWNVEPNEVDREKANHEGVQIELRWAVADWGVIPLNPTLYAEWVERGGPQDKANKYELKLLMSDELLPNLYYATNLILEQEVEGELENELGWSNALSTTIIDRKLLAGVECLWSGVNVHGARDTRTNEFTIGPSIQLRPTNRTFLNVVSLFGTTEDAPECQMYIIFGYQFGGRAGPSDGYIAGPASTIGN